MTWDHWIAFLCFHADKYLLSSEYEAFISKWKQEKCTCVQAYLVSSRSWLHNPTRAVPAFPVLWHLPSLLSGSRLAYAHQTPGDRAPVHGTEKWDVRLESSSAWKMKVQISKSFLHRDNIPSCFSESFSSCWPERVKQGCNRNTFINQAEEFKKRSLILVILDNYRVFCHIMLFHKLPWGASWPRSPPWSCLAMSH